MQDSERSYEGSHVILVMSVASPWSVDIAIGMRAQGVSLEVVTRMYPYDYEADSILREGTERLASNNITVTWPRKWMAKLPSALTMALHLRVRSQTIIKRNRSIHVLCLYGGMQAIAAWLSGIRPYSVFWVGSDLLLQGAARRPIIRRLSTSARYNFVNGLHMVSVGMHRFGLTTLRNHYIGINTKYWMSEGPRDPNLAICTRWFEPVYGNEVVIEAAGLLHAQGTDIKFQFTSSGKQLNECQTLANQLAPERVNFLGGVSRDILHSALSAASIYVSMSRSDGTSTALLEAMAMGLFPILSDIPANREWICNHGCDGILVPVNDVVALAKALDVILNSPTRVRESRAHNRAIVEMLADGRHNLTNLAEMLFTKTTKDNAK